MLTAIWSLIPYVIIRCAIGSRGPFEMRSQTSFSIIILQVSMDHSGQLTNPVNLSRLALVPVVYVSSDMVFIYFLM